MTLINNKEYIEKLFIESKEIFSDFRKQFGDNYFLTTNNHAEQYLVLLNTLMSVNNYSTSFLHLNELKNSIESIINMINTSSNSRSQLGKKLTEITNFNTLIEKSNQFFSNILQEVKDDINSIRDEYCIELDKKVSDITNENTILNDNIKKQLESIKHIQPNIKEQQNRIESKFKSTEELISSFENKVNEHTKESRVSLRNLNANLRQELSDKTEELLHNISSDVKHHLLSTENEIKALKQQSEEDHLAFKSIYENMVGMYVEAGNERLAKHNLEQAQIEKESADKMRSMGIGLLFVLIGFAAWFLVLLAQLPAEVNYLSWFIPRFLTLTFCSTPAIYLLKESASHRHKENLYRQRGTQLATIDAYLADFDDTNKVGVKSDLAKNFYTVHNGKADTSNVPDFIKQMKEFAAVTKTFNKMAPAEQPQHQQTQSTPITPIHEASNTEKKQQA